MPNKIEVFSSKNRTGVPEADRFLAVAWPEWVMAFNGNGGGDAESESSENTKKKTGYVPQEQDDPRRVAAEAAQRDRRNGDPSI